MSADRHYSPPCLLSLGDKAARDPSGAEVKNKWSYAPTPPIRLYSMRRDNFTFFTLRYSLFKIFAAMNCDTDEVSNHKQSE
jgi:hypothetical protein